MTNIEQMLQGLHHETAEYFRRQLEEAKEGEPLPPSLISALIKFLKDNDITCEVVEGTAVSDLAEELSDSDYGFLERVK